MTPTNLAAALLKDVPRYALIDGPYGPFMGRATSGEYLHVSDVSSALTTALDPAIAEREKEAKAHEKEIYVWSENYAGLERRLDAAEAVAEKLRGALQIAKSIFDTPIGLRRLGIDPNTDERLIEFRALTTETDNG